MNTFSWLLSALFYKSQNTVRTCVSLCLYKQPRALNSVSASNSGKSYLQKLRQQWKLVLNVIL